MRNLLLSATILLAAGALSGCETLAGLVGRDKDPAEARAEQLRLPPDLNAGAAPAGSAPADDGAQARPPQAELGQADDRPALILPDSFYDAWRRVGLAIERLGFTLEDRNRAEGRYFVRYDPRAEQGRREEGFLDWLAFWRDDEPDRVELYVIQLKQDDGRTVVTVTGEDGKPAPADVAERVLTLLHDQLR
jgi:outer membrane protein assembly factor BamC